MNSLQKLSSDDDTQAGVVQFTRNQGYTSRFEGDQGVSRLNPFIQIGTSTPSSSSSSQWFIIGLSSL